MSQQMRPPVNTPTSSNAAFTITLKSLRNPPLSLLLDSQSPATSVFELKCAVSKHLGMEGEATENIRLLYKKKPCSDSKTVKEIVGDEDMGGKVEFGVMIIGGAGATGANAESTNQELPAGLGNGRGLPAAQGPSGKEVLETEEFWKDLRGFLVQRVREEGTADEVWRAARESWSTRGGK